MVYSRETALGEGLNLGALLLFPGLFILQLVCRARPGHPLRAALAALVLVLVSGAVTHLVSQSFPQAELQRTRPFLVEKDYRDSYMAFYLDKETGRPKVFESPPAIEQVRDHFQVHFRSAANEITGGLIREEDSLYSQPRTREGMTIPAETWSSVGVSTRRQ